MRIGITKQPLHVKYANYAVFASGTTSDVWFEDEDAGYDAHELGGKQTGSKEAYDS